MNDVELLQRMVSIPSLSGQEEELAGFLVREMAARGLRAHVDEAGNAVGELGEGPEEILLLGHMDTVPGQVPVQIANGRLYGRGSVDAKGPLAAFIAAVTRVGLHPLRGARPHLVSTRQAWRASTQGKREGLSRVPVCAGVAGSRRRQRLPARGAQRARPVLRCPFCRSLRLHAPRARLGRRPVRRLM